MHLQHRFPPCLVPLLRLTAVLSGMACATLAQAHDTATRPAWSLRGFGSAGVAYSHDADAEAGAAGPIDRRS